MADNMGIFMHAIRIQESGDNYGSVGQGGHFGAYQFSMGTWAEALRLAGLVDLVWLAVPPNLVPASVQDAAARALMSRYYGQFHNSFYDVAEAWYGGPGAVGHPDEGGGPGFPTVGQYAAQVMSRYHALGGTGGGGPATLPATTTYVPATLLELLLAVDNEAIQRGIGDAHSREQAAALVAGEAHARIEAVNNTREQDAAALAGEVNARIEAVDHTREQMIALVAGEALARISAVDHTREQDAAAVAAETSARISAVNDTREQDAAALAGEVNARIGAVNDTRQQVAATVKALSDQLTARIAAVLKYAQSLPGLVDQRAAAGYDPTLRSRGGLIQRLLDTAVAHDPAIAGLVSDLARLAIDLAGIDDPVLKIAATLVLKQVIDRLGLDTTLQAMLSDLVGDIIGGGQPRTLQAVTASIGNRLDALEAGQAALSPLAPEADQLHQLGTLAFDAALLGYLAAAVGDPVTTADDTITVLAPVTGPLLGPVRALLGVA